MFRNTMSVIVVAASCLLASRCSAAELGAGRRRQVGLSDRGGRQRLAVDPARRRGTADVPAADDRREAADRLRPAAARPARDHPRATTPICGQLGVGRSISRRSATEGYVIRTVGDAPGHRRRGAAGQHVRRVRAVGRPSRLPLVRPGREPHPEVRAAGPRPRSTSGRCPCSNTASRYSSIASTATGARGTA